MNKERVVFTLVVISILLISISFVSAGWFDNVLGKITGKTTENETDEEIISEPECSSVAISMWCPDETTLCPMKTDEQGCSVWDCDSCETTSEPEPPIEEICGNDICQEGEVCDIDCCENICALECPNGVVKGSCGCECVETEPEPPRDDKECKEGGIKYYTCDDGTKLPWCGCENDDWVCKISVKDDCPDSGPEPKTCASKTQITFNKDVYKIGDDVKIIIEIFDSQGNHLPNYAFYAQMYDDRWHTPELQKTDSKGYFIVTTTAEKPDGGVTEVKFKVYTKEISSCGSVEDTAEVRIKLEGCGIGGCAPEPECKNKIKMCGGECPPCPGEKNKTDIFYPCAGCELEEKCYPYGFRKAGNYCSDKDDLFIVQSGDDGKCENNFECETNLCINDNCVSSNVWNKFLVWFKKIVGGEDEEPKEKTDCSKVLIEEDIGEWEYKQTLYGPGDAQVPIYSEDGEQKEIIKCCAAQYQSQDGKEGMGVVCSLGNKKEVQNSFKWLLAYNTRLSLGEYKGEKVLNDQNKVVAWTSKKYIVATGADGEGTLLVDEDLAGAYLNRYPNDLELTEDDIPVIVNGKPWVFCTEEDEKLGKECKISGGMLQTDPSALDGTVEGKKSCIDSKGFGEGCCEVYVGCANSCDEMIHASDRWGCYIDLAIKNKDVNICEKIDDSDRKNKCYVNVAEHTGDSSICDKVIDDDLKEKCYFWVAEQEGDMKYPMVTCKSEEDMSKEECYFFDDFEGGLDNWVFNNVKEGKESIVDENGNRVLRLNSVIQPDLPRNWDNYLFKFRFKRIEGSMHVNFRKISRHEGQSRYIVAMSSQMNNLNKHFNVYDDENWEKLVDTNFGFDEGWHTLEIRGYDNILNVYLDDKILYKYKDTENPFLSGMPGFEIHTGGLPITPEFLIDDVEVKLITEEDIVYP